MNNQRQEICHLCANLGKDRLLVQGAGGNASWKEGGVLWVKASGTWLANAVLEDIFVPINLGFVQNALNQEDFDVRPELISIMDPHTFRPSIETMLHALMPQKIVVHLHAINALSYLVKKDCEIFIKNLFLESTRTQKINYAFLGYHMPGAELAKAIFGILHKNQSLNLLFLKNHGIVVGADSVEEIYTMLKLIDAIFPHEWVTNTTNLCARDEVSAPKGYIAFANDQAQGLALNPDLYSRLHLDWALFPDHVVFLGPKAFTYSSESDFLTQERINSAKPELIFIENVGVFVKPDFNQAKTAQLICYYDVISRLSPDSKLDPLDEKSINALLAWEAEKYRKIVMK